MVSEAPSSNFQATGLIGNLKIVLPLPEELESQEKNRLAKEKEKLETLIEKMKVQLANVDFVARAPQALIEKNKAQLEKSQTELTEIMKKLG
jgi:valyl-tRNA synthetase